MSQKQQTVNKHNKTNCCMQSCVENTFCYKYDMRCYVFKILF